MELAATEEIFLPRARAWIALSDFAAFEALLAERDVGLSRVAEGDSSGLGTRWHGAATIESVRWPFAAEVTEIQAPSALRLEMASGGIEGALAVELHEAGAERSRADVRLALGARGVRARLVLQPLKLAQGRLEARFGRAVASFARRLEARAASSA
jgi:carbon monoxide dehydrogenase subunit G